MIPLERTKLCERKLPDYTKGEEIFNMVTHIVGGGLGVIILVSCILVSVLHKSVMGIITSAIYGFSVISLYTLSSVYHGLRPSMGKKVLQVLDHCTIYLLIAGTYTPILLCAILPIAPITAIALLAFVWGCAALAATLTAIDLKKYGVFSMICYITTGWCITIDIPSTISAITPAGFYWLLSGGIAYTIGAVLYGLGRHHKYVHSVFHIFTVIGSLLQYVCIIAFVL